VNLSIFAHALHLHPAELTAQSPLWNLITSPAPAPQYLHLCNSAQTPATAPLHHLVVCTFAFALHLHNHLHNHPHNNHCSCSAAPPLKRCTCTSMISVEPQHLLLSTSAPYCTSALPLHYLFTTSAIPLQYLYLCTTSAQPLHLCCITCTLHLFTTTFYLHLSTTSAPLCITSALPLHHLCTTSTPLHMLCTIISGEPQHLCICSVPAPF
jgi:hypothetical protein